MRQPRSVAQGRWRFASPVAADLFPGPEEVSDDVYVRYIRGFRQSQLIGLVASVAPAHAFGQASYGPHQARFTPWGLADVARVSLVFGNSHRYVEPTMRELDRGVWMHNHLGHPGLVEQEPGAVAHAFLQLALQQIPHQTAPGRLIGRTIALFDHTTPADPSRIEVLRDDWQHQLLGCSLVDYIGACQLLCAAAQPNGGRFNPDWLDLPHMTEVADIFDPSTVRHVLTEHLVADVATFSRRDRERPGIGRRFSFNPLQETPVVSGLGPDLLMPVPDYVLWRPTPSGLYFTGRQRWGDKFSRDLGELFQAYVGRQLGLVSDAELCPEIEYDNDKKKSVDWIMIFPDLVLLVEVKSARPTAPVRAGAPEAAAAMEQAFNKAHLQLDRTYECITTRVAAFDHIPTDRPILGLVVTLDDFQVANSPLHMSMYARSTGLPTMIISSDELESLVCLGDQLAPLLLENVRQADPPASLHQAIAAADPPDNPILRAGADDAPIMRVRDDTSDGPEVTGASHRIGDDQP